MKTQNREIAVLLYNLRSVYNTASIWRTADCGNITKIYLVGTTPSPYNQFNELRKDFVKVSLGAEKNIIYEKIKNLPQAIKLIKNLKAKNYKIISIEQHKNSLPFYKINKYLNHNEKILLILGGETAGVPKEILKISNYIIEIPIKGKLISDQNHPKKTKRSKESLNVSIAFAIALFKILYP